MPRRRLTRDLQAEAAAARQRERLETDDARREVLRDAELEVWRRHLEGLGVTGKADIERLARQLRNSGDLVRSRHSSLTHKPRGVNPFVAVKPVVPNEAARDADARARFVADMVQAGFSREDALQRLQEISDSPMFCGHAHEMPHPCPCPPYCYCRVHGNCRNEE